MMNHQSGKLHNIYPSLGTCSNKTTDTNINKDGITDGNNNSGGIITNDMQRETRVIKSIETVEGTKDTSKSDRLRSPGHGFQPKRSKLNQNARGDTDDTTIMIRRKEASVVKDVTSEGPEYRHGVSSRKLNKDILENISKQVVRDIRRDIKVKVGREVRQQVDRSIRNFSKHEYSREIRTHSLDSRQRHIRNSGRLRTTRSRAKSESESCSCDTEIECKQVILCGNR